MGIKVIVPVMGKVPIKGHMLRETKKKIMYQNHK